MPISYKYKFKFIHIPKTGGTSLEVVFDLQHENNLYQPRFSHKIKGVSFAPQHFTHNMIDYFKPECKDYFSFTVVRNPFTKIISEYFYINNILSEVSEVIMGTVGKYIKEFDEGDFNKWLDTSLVEFNIDHKLPQSTFIDKPVDMVLKLENIEEDFNRLNLKLGTNYRLIHENKSSISKKDIVNNLSKNTKEKIYNIFKKDFINFEYESNI